MWTMGHRFEYEAGAMPKIHPVKDNANNLFITPQGTFADNAFFIENA